MPKIVLRYFDVRGLGEAIRTLLAYGGEDFEDIRYTEVDWPNVLSSTPFNQLPTLEIDGKVYAQSNAIARYLGHKYGLAGDSMEESLEIDQNVDYFTDLRSSAIQVHYEEDPEVKKKLQNKCFKETAPAMLKKLNDIISRNNGHIALGKLTWGDFVFAGVFDYLKLMLELPELEKQYPSFQKVIDSVYSVPKVKAFSDLAPKTDV
ncbi:glutathione S-transferase 2-like [Zerene cesonia]|uniref:glutathione S-transferase 2-like n=1 Tax=Zerene cesonia TaxID=33412 RepID=UPI0018E585B3|nr:glutathione S-transferase 2-like [Zerene cesonia]